MPEDPSNSKLSTRLLFLLAAIWAVASQVWYYSQFSEPIRAVLTSLRAGFLR